jgi:hypothetical protein
MTRRGPGALSGPEALASPRPSHLKGPLRDVDVLNLNSGHLPLPHPGLGPEAEEGREGTVHRARGSQDGPQLFRGERVDALALDTADPKHAQGRIGR